MAQFQGDITPAAVGRGALPLVTILVSVAALLEGMDAQIQGYTAPAIIALWHISKPAFSPVFVAFQFGFLLGAAGIGGLGDALGRRHLLVINVLLFGIFTLAGAFCTSVPLLAASRWASALFLGGTIPNAIALLIDSAPKDRPAGGVGIMYIVYTAGGAGGGFLSAWLLPSLGWQSIYWVCGSLAVAFSGVLFFLLPESPALPSGNDTMARDRKFRVGDLFRERRSWMTTCLWAAFCANQIALQFSNSWIPTILKSAGQSYSHAAAAGGLFQAGGALGSLVCGFLLGGRRGLKWLILASLGAAPVLVLTGQAISAGWILNVLLASVGMCVIGSQTGLNAAAGFLYPPALRSTAAGWANGMGRIGSMVGPLVGAALIGSDMPVGAIFAAAAVPPLCVALFVFVAQQTRPATGDNLPAGEISTDHIRRAP